MHYAHGLMAHERVTRMNYPLDVPPPRSRGRGRLVFLAILAAVLIGARTALRWYVESLWFESLGYRDVFWKTVNLRSAIFLVFTLLTFAAVYGAYRALKPDRLNELAAGAFLINGRPLTLPIEPVLNVVALAVSLVIGLLTGASLAADWTTLALYWYAPESAPADVDPIFAKPLTFYLFTLPAWQLLVGWLTLLAATATAIAVFFTAITGGGRLPILRRPGPARSWRGLCACVSVLLVAAAARTYLGRFARLFEEHTIFSGVTYTDAHVILPGALFAVAALVVGAGIALVSAVVAPRLRWLVAALVPAAVCYILVSVIGGYVNGFVVKPNELVRERPYIAHNIAQTRRAYALDRVAQQPFPADPGVEAVDVANNRATLRNIRLWDWRALQDTLRQIQEIRTYYDFPDIDIDRYDIDGSVRQVMLAVRELNVDKLPASSRNWINEKLIYTHGYGVTMNPVDGFTSEGLPALMLSNMPVQSTVKGLTVTRPEIYFGELTNTDVYVNTRQKEFNYPQGESNNLTSYEGQGGIVLGGFLRRLAIAFTRGDVAKLPFSDDVTSDSRLLMRRSIRDRVAAIAPFLTLDDDPYIVLGEDGRLSWMLDGFTTSNHFPYARHYRLGRDTINYIRNSVKVVIDAYDGSTLFYVFDPEDPVIAAYRRLYPGLFKDASALQPDLYKHVRYPELMLTVQASIYGLYHMTEPDVFYNREDLWTVASQVGMDEQRGQTAQPMEPNFVLMTLPGEKVPEFIEILPFTPANRNNLIGWIAGRSDGAHYGTAIVYDFPKTRLVDGPMQIEARIDQDPQLSSQLSLWNQQGSRVRRGSLIVIPVGRALLFAESIYLQADRSPMPQLRLIVLALQDRLAYGPTFESAMAALFGGQPSSLSAAAASTQSATAPQTQGAAQAQAPASPGAGASDSELIAGAARDLADYQRLTADGKLGEAGQKLEALKSKLEQLQKPRR
jgi:uncharacterized protein